MRHMAATALLFSIFLTLAGCSGERDPTADASTAPAPLPGTTADEGSPPQPGSPAATPRETIPDGHTSRDALDWAGIYSGVLPCASCPGIETTVTLHADGSYQLSLLYIDRSATPHVSTGMFSWDTEGRTITLEAGSDEAQQYQVGENLLFHLDRDGRRIEGDLAHHYILHKHLNDPRIENRRWVLIELRGQSVETQETARPAFMVFGSENSRVSGNASCNSFNGAYAIKSGDRIVFARNMAVTMMACPDMDLEAAFLETLPMIDNYRVGDDGQLSLNRARMAPLARFVAADDAQ